VTSCVRPEVLALGVHRGTLAALVRAAHGAGAVAFSAHDVAGARARFLLRGSLDVLVIAPDTTPHVAETVSRTIWAIDPGVDIVVFGRELLREQTHANVHRLADLHPTSRAGLGALRRHVAARCTPDRVR
jgi:hypothetical protein